MAANTLRVPARDRTLQLLATLALADVVAQAGLLLALAVFAVTDGDRGAVSVSRGGSHWLVRRLLSLRVRSLQPIAVVLAAVSHSERRALHLATAHDLWLHVPDELRATGSLLEGRFAAHELLILAAPIQAMH